MQAEDIQRITNTKPTKQQTEPPKKISKFDFGFGRELKLKIKRVINLVKRDK